MTVESLEAEEPVPTLPESGANDPALKWWNRYCHPETGDAGVRARLRRSRSTIDALRVPAAVVLARQLGVVTAERPAPDWKVRAAVDLARVLSHVRQHDSRHPMRAAGWKSFPGDRRESDAGEERPRLSEARYRRLLETGGGEELVRAFTRLIGLLKGEINVTQLARDYLRWEHPVLGNRVREQWAFQYLAAGDSAPPLPTTNEDGEA